MTPRDRAKEVVKEMGETGQIVKVAWMLEIEKAIIAAIEESSTIVTQAELERMLAIEHLFSILDGDDEQVAKDEARTWLKEKYGDSYAMLSSIARRVYQTGNAVEWPEELEVRDGYDQS